MENDDRKVYALKKPIQVGSETITELRFRAVKAKDLRQLPTENRTMGDMLNIVGKLCGQPPNVIDELGDEDLQEVSSFVGGF
jgi:hypothetical protein